MAGFRSRNVGSPSAGGNHRDGPVGTELDWLNHTGYLWAFAALLGVLVEAYRRVGAALPTTPGCEGMRSIWTGSDPMEADTRPVIENRDRCAEDDGNAVAEQAAD